MMWLSGQSSAISRRFYKTRPRVHHHHVWPGNLLNGTGSAKEETQEACQFILCVAGFHVAPTSQGAIGDLMQATGIDDIMVAVEVCIRGTANRIISGKEYYAMLHVHTMVHASLFTIHLEALARWLTNEEKYLLMHACLQCPSIPRCPVRK